MDYQLFQWINGFAGQNFLLDHLFEALTSYGPYLYVAILFVLAIRQTGRVAATEGFISACLAIGLNYLIGLVYFRPRPFIAHHVHMLLPHPADASFPSDHTAGTMAIAMAILAHNRKLGYPLVIGSLLVGISRIYVGHHYPTDVIGGALVGIIVGLSVYKLQLGQKVLAKIPFVSKKRSTSGSY